MHHDKKVGLGLGILLVGIVGAFFFREEPRARDPLPELQSAELLDREISAGFADKPQPKSDLQQYERRYEPVINLQGIQTAGSEAGVPSNARRVFDEEFDFLNDPSATSTAKPEERPVAGTEGKQHPATGEDSGTAQNAIVSRTSTPRELPSAKAMFAEDLSSADEEASAEPFPEDDRPAVTESLRVYVVQKGDTLSEIASRLLGRQIEYRKIFDLNRDQLSSPDDLRPGMRLKIPAREQSAKSTAVSLTEPRESQTPDSPPQNPKSNEPPASKRDRRVIVPRRVRLNEPVANNPGSHPANRPRVRFKLDDPATESMTESGLPTLEGLQPLDLPR